MCVFMCTYVHIYKYIKRLLKAIQMPLKVCVCPNTVFPHT